MLLLCNMVMSVDGWMGFNSPGSGAAMKEQKGAGTVRMPHLLYICPQRGLWVIKCG